MRRGRFGRRGGGRPVVVGRLAWRASPIGARLVALAGALLGGVAWLLVSLYRLQVVESGQFHQGFERQSVRRVRLPAIRGSIYDRSGICLVDNRPSYDVLLYVEELRRSPTGRGVVDQAQELIGRLGGLLGMAPAVERQELLDHLEQARPLPLVLWEDLEPAQVARLLENQMEYRGVDVVARPVRHYPYGALAGHLIGYLGRTSYLDEEQLNEFHFFLPDTVGRAGVERALDQELRGWAGVQLLQVDVMGYTHAVLSGRSRPALRGKDLFLTIDRGLQAVLEEAIGARRGAAVALDPRDGEVLALVSMPGLNPEDFTPRLARRRMAELMEDPGRPFTNRALYAVYPPGSTFKPIVALAGLEAGVIDETTTVVCFGSTYVGQARFRCGSQYGHGAMDLVQALGRSCNVYFYEVGARLGLDPIGEMARRFHLGERFGIPCDAESPGLIPTDAWKRQHYGDRWRAGDTANLSIGQGSISVTVLGMASVASTLANGGSVWRPRLVRGLKGREPEGWAPTRPELLGRIDVQPRNLAVVRRGMREAVQGTRGTGRRAAVHGVEIAGKTGTAEYVENGERRKHAWFIGFAPFEDPEIALAVLIEDAEGGGHDAGPVAARALAYRFASTPVIPEAPLEPDLEVVHVPR